jgi:hypothetical protein
MDTEPAALSVASTLRDLTQEGVTGCLRLERGSTQGAIWLRGGQIYTASAPEARPRLGDRLIGAGHITAEQLEAALQTQSSMSQAPRIGELLISSGLIDRETMREYVSDQTIDSVAAMLGWTDGQWVFEPGEEVAEDVALDMSTENLLMDAARRLEEFEVILAQLGSLDAIVDFAGKGQAELALQPDEWAMLTGIDGSTSVRDLAEGAGYSQLETARIVYGLLTTGIVQVVGRAEPPDQPAEPEPEKGARAAELDRNELLREFAALDEETPRRGPAPAPAPERAAEPPRPRPAPRRPQPEKRKSIFDRFRRG